ncbi:hypothetical protein HK098_008091 [Nowakowskiella sp. JEL0407]|nr:hypothetical protein HK098_008077 [Nowakowskiella sp. JEL0407]KAJ3129857.1 hypothetical protein HK098_008091 [Nowakowskiella sp. JEL0407]
MDVNDLLKLTSSQFAYDLHAPISPFDLPIHSSLFGIAQPAIADGFMNPDIQHSKHFPLTDDGNLSTSIPTSNFTFNSPSFDPQLPLSISQESLQFDQIIDSSMVLTEPVISLSNPVITSQLIPPPPVITESVVEEEEPKRKRQITRKKETQSKASGKASADPPKRQRRTKAESSKSNQASANPPTPPSSEERSVSPNMPPTINAPFIDIYPQNLAAAILSLQQQSVNAGSGWTNPFSMMVANGSMGGLVGYPPINQDISMQNHSKSNVSPEQQAAMFQFSVNEASDSKSKGRSKSTTKSAEGTAIKSGSSRKVAHNAIERRYRNNINDRIAELKQVVPALAQAKVKKGGNKKNESDSSDCESSDYDSENEKTKPGQKKAATKPVKIADGIPIATKLNKATVLKKATDYIVHLKRVSENQRMVNERLRALVQQFPNGGLVLQLFDEEERRRAEEEERRWNQQLEEKEKMELERKQKQKRERKDKSTAVESASTGVKQFAIWILCVAAITIPSPFEFSESEGPHVHTDGRVVSDNVTKTITPVHTNWSLPKAHTTWFGMKYIAAICLAYLMFTTILSILVPMRPNQAKHTPIASLIVNGHLSSLSKTFSVPFALVNLLLAVIYRTLVGFCDLPSDTLSKRKDSQIQLASSINKTAAAMVLKGDHRSTYFENCVKLWGERSVIGSIIANLNWTLLQSSTEIYMGSKFEFIEITKSLDSSEIAKLSALETIKIYLRRKFLLYVSKDSVMSNILFGGKINDRAFGLDVGYLSGLLSECEVWDKELAGWVGKLLLLIDDTQELDAVDEIQSATAAARLLQRVSTSCIYESIVPSDDDSFLEALCDDLKKWSLIARGIKVVDRDDLFDASQIITFALILRIASRIPEVPVDDDDDTDDTVSEFKFETDSGKTYVSDVQPSIFSVDSFRLAVSLRQLLPTILSIVRSENGSKDSRLHGELVEIVSNLQKRISN